MKKIFVARTRSALKSRAQLGNLDLNNYVILKLNQQARENKVIKSVIPQVEDDDYKYIMIHKSFVVITTDGKLNVDTNMIGKNQYAEDMNTPEEEKPGDKYVSEGTIKSLLSKVSNTKDFDKKEKEVLSRALKNWGEHAGDEVSKEDEYVEGLEASDDTVKLDPDVGDEPGPTEPKQGSTKSQNVEEDSGGEKRDSVKEDTDTENDDRTEKSEAAKDEDDEDEEKVETLKALSAMREKVRNLDSPDVKNELLSNLKSFGSIDPTAPVFQSKHAAARFSQIYNNKVNGVEKAEVQAADRHVRKRYGTRARFIVSFE